MRKLIVIIPLLFVLAGLCFYFSPLQAKGVNMDNKKILIAYYSYSGNTKSIAEKIQSITNGAMFEIQTVNSYPADYNSVVEQAKQEKQQGYLPPLKAKPDNIAQYDVIFLGSPVWWYTMAPAVKSFLAQNDLSGKIIMPFCTHGGGGASSTFSDMKTYIKNADFKPGIEIYESGNSKTIDEIKNWITKNL